MLVALAVILMAIILIIIVGWLIIPLFSILGANLNLLVTTMENATERRISNKRKPIESVEGFAPLDNKAEMQRQIKEWFEQDLEVATGAYQIRLDFIGTFDHLHMLRQVRNTDIQNLHRRYKIMGLDIDHTTKLINDKYTADSVPHIDLASSLREEYNRLMGKLPMEIPPRVYKYDKDLSLTAHSADAIMIARERSLESFFDNKEWMKKAREIPRESQYSDDLYEQALEYVPKQRVGEAREVSQNFDKLVDLFANDLTRNWKITDVRRTE